MHTAFVVFRILHIAAGMLAFFVAPGALLTRKGALWHRRWGRIYFWSMAVVAGTAVPMTFIHPNPFLLMVGVFSFYLAFSGYRILYHKRPEAGQGPTALDWTGAVIGMVGSLGLIVYGLIALRGSAFGIVAPIFGALGAMAAGRDMFRYVHPPADRRAWLYGHMGNMMGAYIATLSAFSAVNMSFLPPLLRWLWPTLLGVPVLILWIVRYQRKYAVTQTRNGDYPQH